MLIQIARRTSFLPVLSIMFLAAGGLSPQSGWAHGPGDEQKSQSASAQVTIQILRPFRLDAAAIEAQRRADPRAFLLRPCPAVDANERPNCMMVKINFE